jgi:2-polyprenyl-3-methyl-5-hydroxy-6-metoxy-1,4-benzoquinol methylase
MTKEWFANWFDSPYYHVLYQNHNELDAQRFINNLLAHLTPQYKGSATQKSDICILDLACGKGRHSRYMSDKGFDVTGLDLSESSIKYAQQFETESLHFYQHDMRKAFRINYYDFIFNFFTSFGYFEHDKDNLITLKHINEGLKPDGIFIMDYFNSQWVLDTLKKDYVQTTGGIDFHIKKHVRTGHVIKKIAFNTEGVDYKFQEKVRLFTLKDFQQLYAQAGFKILDLYGDYDLNAFDEKNSKRLIIKAKRLD